MNVQYSPGAVAEFIIVWCILIAHIHEGLYRFYKKCILFSPLLFVRSRTNITKLFVRLRTDITKLFVRSRTDVTDCYLYGNVRINVRTVTYGYHSYLYGEELRTRRQVIATTGMWHMHGGTWLFARGWDVKG